MLCCLSPNYHLFIAFYFTMFKLSKSWRLLSCHWRELNILYILYNFKVFFVRICQCLWFICLFLLSSPSLPPAGVSNWGGYAVACGLYLLHTCPSHQRYLKKGLGLENTTPREQLQDWTANLPSVDKVTDTNAHTHTHTPIHTNSIFS